MPRLEELLGEEYAHVLAKPIEDYLDAIATERDPPALALAACTLRIEEAAPALLAVLARAADGEDLSERDAMLLFRGLHILGGAREPRAFAPLLRLLARTPEEVDFLLGDALTETVPRIAAGVFDGDAEALFAAIEGGAADEFAREMLLGAAAFLTWDGRIDRARMQAFLERFPEARPAADGEVVWIGWLQAIALLGLRPLAPLVMRAWDEGRVPEDIMTRGHFERDLAAAERAPEDIARFTRANLGYIEDVVQSLTWTRTPTTPADRRHPMLAALAGGPATNPWRDVGRNDPCPCGSGRKAKKCCLAN